MSKPILAMIPSAYRSGTVYSVLPNNGDGDFTFSRASSATRVNQNGLIELVGSNVPRLDYSDGSCPSLLLEPQRTNLYLNSEELSTQNVTTLSDKYTVSFYGTGTITFSGSYSGSLVGLGENQRVSLTFTATAGTLTSTVSGSVLNAQIEQGDYPTSYIPTTGSAETRLKDECINGGDSDLFGITEGTFFIDANNFGTPLGGYNMITLSDGANTFVRYLYESSRIRTTVFNGVVQHDYFIIGVNDNERNKLAITFKQNEFKIYFNGILKDTDTSGVVPTGFDRLRFAAQNISSRNFEGKVYDTRVYNRVLTEAEAIELTTL